MSTEAIAFEKGVAPVFETLLPDSLERLIDFQPDPELQKRIEDLAARSNEGLLTDTERKEYEGYVRANKFVAILRRQARRVRASGSASA